MPFTSLQEKPEYCSPNKNAVLAGETSTTFFGGEEQIMENQL